MNCTECYSGCTLVLEFGFDGFMFGVALFLELFLDCTECLDGYLVLGFWHFGACACVSVCIKL